MPGNFGVIFRGHNILSKDSLFLVYRYLIQPYLEYCNLIWADGNICNNLDILFHKHKKVIRAITFAKWNAHTSSIVKILNFFKYISE